MMRKLHLAPLFFLCVALSGCAVRATQGEREEGRAELLSAARPFAEQVAELPQGASQFFTDSPFGPATVEGGTAYVSGLDSECRSARATRGTEHFVFAVCRGSEADAWRFIPSIFESVPR